ncbi:MAG: hypothetical protein M1828_000583 [Chrysothrix sp. TS-e1954]|nr:MAG: hypothetical protein M1828_000583 [Chrysothrix sp. TS-e1954]
MSAIRTRHMSTRRRATVGSLTLPRRTPARADAPSIEDGDAEEEAEYNILDVESVLRIQWHHEDFCVRNFIDVLSEEFAQVVDYWMLGPYGNGVRVQFETAAAAGRVYRDLPDYMRDEIGRPVRVELEIVWQMRQDSGFSARLE